MDDASTDNTLELLAAMDDPRCMSSNSSQRRRQRRRHAGILAARGDLIAFQDSDDFWLPKA